MHEEKSSTVSTNANTQDSMANPNKVVNKAKLWHLRLGHLPISKLHILFLEINTKFVKTQIICTICPLGRKTRVVYPQSCSMTYKPLELLHIDVWGPFCHLTRLNCSMFITIVDDISRMSWIFLVKRKSEIPKVFKDFVCYIENQLSATTKAIRTDNAPELTKGEVAVFYTQKGIKNQSSCVDTPQQNRVIERKHKHLLETARTLPFQSNLPIKF